MHAAAAEKDALWVNHLSAVLLSSKALEHSPTAQVVFIGSSAAASATDQDMRALLSTGDATFMVAGGREYAATKMAQLLVLDELSCMGSSVKLVIPSMTVNTSLVQTMWGQIPLNMKQQMAFGDGQLAAVQIVNAAMQPSPNAARVSGHAVCFGGCRELPCERMYSTSSLSAGLWGEARRRSLELAGVSPSCNIEAQI